jgi:hypothetical protein
MIKHWAKFAVVIATILTPVVHAEEAIDPESLFIEAMELREDGDLFDSIAIFESILSNQPGLGRARLELAIAYHRALQFRDARDQLTKVLNDPETPDEVKLTISGYLAQLGSDEKAAAKRTSSTIYISTGFFTDSNINLAPNAELSDSATKKTGIGMIAMASYSHTSRPSKPIKMGNKPLNFEWRTQATSYAKVYSGTKTDFNLQLLSINTGPALVVEKSWNAKLNIQIDEIYYSGEEYAFNVGLNPSFTYIMADQLEITAETKATLREFDTAPELEGVKKMHGFKVSKYFAKQAISLQGGMRYHSNGADAPHLNANGIEAYINGQISSGKDTQVYAQISSRDYEYKTGNLTNAITSDDIARDETETRLRLGISHKFNNGLLKTWKLNTQFSRTSNDSNIPALNYDRNVIEVNIRKYF